MPSTVGSKDGVLPWHCGFGHLHAIIVDFIGLPSDESLCYQTLVTTAPLAVSHGG